MYERTFSIEEDSTAQGLPYDFESNMHFQHNVFSISEQIPTIIPLSARLPSRSLGVSKTGTYLDFLHVKILYCGGKYLIDTF